jgi:hypothetical protein
MRFIVGMLASVSVAAVSLALADPPAAPDSSAAAAAQAAPAATPGSAAGTPTASVNVTAQADQMEKHFVSEGYKIEMHHGDKYFCRREEVLGSRLGGQKYCSTLEQLTAHEAEAKELVERSQRQQTTGPSGGK